MGNQTGITLRPTSKDEPPPEHVLDVFAAAGYHPRMTDTSQLRPATADEIAETLSFALQFEGRKRVRSADSLMAEITAERLVRHLERSGFVLMKRPAGAAPTTAGMLPPI